MEGKLELLAFVGDEYCVGKNLVKKWGRFHLNDFWSYEGVPGDTFVCLEHCLSLLTGITRVLNGTLKIKLMHCAVEIFRTAHIMVATNSGWRRH